MPDDDWLDSLGVSRFLFISIAYFMAMGVLRVIILLFDNLNQTSMSELFKSFWIILVITYGLIFAIISFIYIFRFFSDIVSKYKYGE